MKYRLFVILIVFVGVQAHSPEEQPECATPILLPQGWVQGEEFTSTDGKPFCSYRGLRYAEPPLGKLRFQPPSPAGPWTGVLNATKDGEFCPQINLITGVAYTNEDCLTLNVYTPSKYDLVMNMVNPNNVVADMSSGSNKHAIDLLRLLNFGKIFPNYGRHRRRLPVLVFIHGGGFAFGDAGFQTYPPHSFMNEDVIVVVIQYRLGIFGFLSTASCDASGNWGLLDQRLALEWVQANIARFGGNRRRVLIFGESAGAGSVMYHRVSERSKGLFHAAIAQSGTVLNHWSIQPDPRFYALKLGEELQCNNTNNDLGTMVSCLRTRSVQSIFGVMVAMKWFDSVTGRFVPVLENPACANFIDESPYTLLEKGDISNVPLIIGCNRDELAFVFLGLAPAAAAAFNKIDDIFYNVSQPALILQATKQRENLLEKSYLVKREYWDKTDVNNRTEVQATAVEFMSDITFHAGSWQTSRMLAKRRFPVYHYLLEHAGNVSLTKVTGHQDVKHGDDLMYLFKRSVLTPGDEQFSRKLVKIWADFARFGIPTPFGQWQGVRWNTVGTGSKLRYLKFGEETNTMEVQSDKMVRREKLWNEQIASYTFKPNV